MRKQGLILSATIAPEAALAGDSVEFAITVELAAGVDLAGSRLVLDMPCTLGMSRPSCHNQEEDGYMAVFASNPDIVYRKRCYNVELLKFITAAGKKTGMDTDGAKRFFVIDFAEGITEPGDSLVIKWGFVRNGMDSGTKVATNVIYRECRSVVDLRYFADGIRAVPDLGQISAPLWSPLTAPTSWPWRASSSGTTGETPRWYSRSRRTTASSTTQRLPIFALCGRPLQAVHPPSPQPGGAARQNLVPVPLRGGGAHHGRLLLPWQLRVPRRHGAGPA